MPRLPCLVAEPYRLADDTTTRCRRGATGIDPARSPAAGRGEIDLLVTLHPLSIEAARNVLDHHVPPAIIARDVQGSILRLRNVDIDRGARRDETEIALHPMAEYQPAMQWLAASNGKVDAERPIRIHLR